MSTNISDQRWLDLIHQCRTSGLTDRQWCIENGIAPSTFYYHVRTLRNKACEIPESTATVAVLEKQEVVPVNFQTGSGTAAIPSEDESELPAVSLEIKGLRIMIHNNASANIIHNTLQALQQLC